MITAPGLNALQEALSLETLVPAPTDAPPPPSSRRRRLGHIPFSSTPPCGRPDRQTELVGLRARAAGVRFQGGAAMGRCAGRPCLLRGRQATAAHRQSAPAISVGLLRLRRRHRLGRRALPRRGLGRPGSVSSGGEWAVAFAGGFRRPEARMGPQRGPCHR